MAEGGFTASDSADPLASVDLLTGRDIKSSLANLRPIASDKFGKSQYIYGWFLEDLMLLLLTCIYLLKNNPIGF